MKQKLLKPVITNEKLVAIVALVLALALFTLVRIVFYSEPQDSAGGLLRLPEAGTAQPSPKTAGDDSGSFKIPILLYHRIGALAAGAGELEKDSTVLPEDFELQVAWLKGQGYESIKLSQLLAHLKDNQPLPKKPVIFTFDDGYKDSFLNAPAILNKYGYVGDFGVVTQFSGISVGGSSYASWREIKQAKSQGMEIVSQTQDNFDGTDPKYTDSFILRNLNDSIKDLKTGTGADAPPILIYPFGRYDTRLTGLARQAGFQMGMSADSGTNVNLKLLMQVPRLKIKNGTNLGEFQTLINNASE